MGVPAFYKWLTQKYPKVVHDCIEERPSHLPNGTTTTVDAAAPNPNGFEITNLFLDMNGIIHPASHPEDRPPPETEDDIFICITEYLERVFNAARPRKLLYMAIDGCAPRAKMNQQRSRRFRSAQEAEEKATEEERLRAEWLAEGREVPAKKEVFDSNVITPGTPFMDRLAAHLRAFTHAKLSSDPAWVELEVILSDGSVPGEGEHKIMEFIRQQRLAPGYDPNTRHALHGLDADLIMLSLATHEPHFHILREHVGPSSSARQGLRERVEEELTREVKAAETGGELEAAAEKRAASKAPTPFQWLHVSILREYLEKEFQTMPLPPGVEWSLERLIDDFIFICFFVGNDFLPHLPSLDIRNGAIDTLCDLYRKLMPELGGWICDGGTVNLGRAKRFGSELGMLEDELLTRNRVSEERQKDRQKRRAAEVSGRTLEARHRVMLQRIAETATVPSAKRLRPSNGASAVAAGDGGADGAARRVALGGDDAALCELFDMIREFKDAPNSTPDRRMPAGLNGFQRAMVHQYCEELGVAEETRGEEPNRAIHLVKRGEGSQEPAAARFKRQLGDILKEKATLPESEDQIKLGLPGWKERYYQQKFPDADMEERRKVAAAYAEGLQWVMRYYYDGCASWTWYFPYHYASFAADIADAIDPEAPAQFELGEPFLPFQQLMAVLPPRSSHALPAPLAELMTDPESEIADFYPTVFDLDLNGKKFLWQAVVLLPFIDEERLLGAAAQREQMLTADERRRNARNKPLLFVASTHALGAPLNLAYGPPPVRLKLTQEHKAGLAGELEPIADAVRLGQMYHVPEYRGADVRSAMRDFVNSALGATFHDPPRKPHVTQLLATVTLPPKKLLAMEGPQQNNRFVRARGGANGRGGHNGAGGDAPYRLLDGGRQPPYALGEQIKGLLAQRAAARAARDFAAADGMRDQLRRMGAEVDDERRAWTFVGAAPQLQPPPLQQPYGYPSPQQQWHPQQPMGGYAQAGPGPGRYGPPPGYPRPPHPQQQGFPRPHPQQGYPQQYPQRGPQQYYPPDYQPAYRPPPPRGALGPPQRHADSQRSHPYAQPPRGPVSHGGPGGGGGVARGGPGGGGGVARGGPGGGGAMGGFGGSGAANQQAASMLRAQLLGGGPGAGGPGSGGPGFGGAGGAGLYGFNCAGAPVALRPGGAHRAPPGSANQSAAELLRQQLARR